MSEVVIFQRLGIALVLGLLVGLQRERTAEGMPGLRTFGLIAVFGAVCALLAELHDGWMLAVGLAMVMATLIFPTLLRLRQADPNPGITTDVAALLMYGVGALTMSGLVEVAVAIGGGVAVLLHFKGEMHRFVAKLGDTDVRAIMQFVLITCIVLPVLPNENFGAAPMDVFNPFHTWLMVVLIVGMSLGGYIVYRFLGRDAGILLGGVLGGAISSTATTVSYSRQARGGLGGVRIATIVILIASTVVFVRVLIEIAVVDPNLLRASLAPLCIVMGLMVIPAMFLWMMSARGRTTMPEQENPTQLKSAIFFAVMYALVLFALAAVREYAGDRALYSVALLSGLTDMDAITLSVARMTEAGTVAPAFGWRLIVTGAIANLVFKAIIAGLLGGRRLLGQVLLWFLFPAVGGTALIYLWPW